MALDGVTYIQARILKLFKASCYETPDILRLRHMTCRQRLARICLHMAASAKMLQSPSSFLRLQEKCKQETVQMLRYVQYSYNPRTVPAVQKVGSNLKKKKKRGYDLILNQPAFMCWGTGFFF